MKTKIKYANLVPFIGALFIGVLAITNENDMFIRVCFIAVIILSLLGITGFIYDRYEKVKK